MSMRRRGCGTGYIIPMPPSPSAGAGTGGFLFLRLVSHSRLCSQQQRRDRCRVLQGGTGDLGGVDDACLEQVLELTGQGVEADPALFASRPAGRPRRLRGRR